MTEHGDGHDAKENGMNLTEFLLARIAEDEAVCQDQLRAWVTRARLSADNWRFQTDDEYRDLHVDPARILAECAAKRELLALADPYDFTDDGGTGMSQHADKIRRLLALPYVEHPDYREEWRALTADPAEESREQRGDRGHAG